LNLTALRRGRNEDDDHEHEEALAAASERLDERKSRSDGARRAVGPRSAVLVWQCQPSRNRPSKQREHKGVRALVELFQTRLGLILSQIAI